MHKIFQVSGIYLNIYYVYNIYHYVYFKFIKFWHQFMLYSNETKIYVSILYNNNRGKYCARFIHEQVYYIIFAYYIKSLY